MVKQNDYLISNQEIIGGLRSAIERGETLKDAMMTFYQSGYSKSDIEDAARSYLNQTNRVEQPSINTTRNQKAIVPAATVKKKSPAIPAPVIKNKPLVPATSTPIKSDEKEKTHQFVSEYSNAKPSKKSGKTLTIVLILILALLLGVLALVFLFKIEFVDFFNNLFN